MAHVVGVGPRFTKLVLANGEDFGHGVMVRTDIIQQHSNGAYFIWSRTLRWNRLPEYLFETARVWIEDTDILSLPHALEVWR